MNIKVKGGQVLSGEITPSGSKNSAVALIPATILFGEKVTLQNIPDITDVQKLVGIMTSLGSKIEWNKETKEMVIDNATLTSKDLSPEELGNIRGTSLLWGPMLARFGKIDFTGLPGGCSLGYRSLDPHFEAFSDLGVKIDENNASIKMDSANAKAGEIWLREMSPTVTENMITFASSLPGKTRIIGAASEPQVQDLCNLMIEAGVAIAGVGSSVLEIEGGKVKGITHKILSDHYEIATFLALAAATGGEIKIHDALPSLFKQIAWVFSNFGVNIKYEGDTAIIEKGTKIIIKEDEERGLLSIKAQPWPSLPVDILPLFIPLALAADNGQVLFHNWMYDAGLFWTSELTKMGANIVMCDPHRVLVTAGKKLTGATLEAPYIIRAVVALIMSAMIADGESEILNAETLYRGHPDFSQKLVSLGAKIEEIK
jgi:UDP-N-acetylglucosamine 1-carboxyvinyltransferase